MRSGSAIALLCYMMVAASVSGSAQPSNTLQPPSVFAAISDPAERSRAIFSEVAKVLTNPRCMNCHPATDRLLQGDDKHPHRPVATRDTTCATCHTDRNFTLHERASYRSIPGHPRWMAAPIEMAWEGKSVGEITTIWLRGDGSRAPDATPPPARRRCSENWSRRGSTPERCARRWDRGRRGLHRHPLKLRRKRMQPPRPVVADDEIAAPIFIDRGADLAKPHRARFHRCQVAMCSACVGP